MLQFRRDLVKKVKPLRGPNKGIPRYLTNFDIMVPPPFNQILVRFYEHEYWFDDVNFGIEGYVESPVIRERLEKCFAHYHLGSKETYVERMKIVSFKKEENCGTNEISDDQIVVWMEVCCKNRIPETAFLWLRARRRHVETFLFFGKHQKIWSLRKCRYRNGMGQNSLGKLLSCKSWTNHVFTGNKCRSCRTHSTFYALAWWFPWTVPVSCISVHLLQLRWTVRCRYGPEAEARAVWHKVYVLFEICSWNLGESEESAQTGNRDWVSGKSKKKKIDWYVRSVFCTPVLNPKHELLVKRRPHLLADFYFEIEMEIVERGTTVSNNLVSGWAQ